MLRGGKTDEVRVVDGVVSAIQAGVPIVVGSREELEVSPPLTIACRTDGAHRDGVP